MASMAWGRGPPKCCTTAVNSVGIVSRPCGIMVCGSGHGKRIVRVPRACKPLKGSAKKLSKYPTA